MPADSLLLTGRVALVTGGASGIGLATGRELAARGAKVALADINEKAAQDAARAIPGALAVQMDVSDYESVRAGLTAAASALGPLQLLVCNAGFDRARRFLETDPGLWRSLIAVNLVGVLNCCHLALPGMIERGFGRVVITASEAGKVGSSGEAVYSATKGGVIAFAKSIARENARRGVTVNAVCPGPTRTPLLEGIGAQDETSQKLVEALTRSVPMRRVAEPEDVAGVVAFLLSEDAAYMTGQAISISGGLTMI